jgi:hypothetical protein
MSNEATLTVYKIEEGFGACIECVKKITVVEVVLQRSFKHTPQE